MILDIFVKFKNEQKYVDFLTQLVFRIFLKFFKIKRDEKNPYREMHNNSKEKKKITSSHSSFQYLALIQIEKYIHDVSFALAEGNARP